MKNKNLTNEELADIQENYIPVDIQICFTANGISSITFKDVKYLEGREKTISKITHLASAFSEEDIELIKSLRSRVMKNGNEVLIKNEKDRVDTIEANKAKQKEVKDAK